MSMSPGEGQPRGYLKRAWPDMVSLFRFRLSKSQFPNPAADACSVGARQSSGGATELFCPGRVISLQDLQRIFTGLGRMIMGAQVIA